MNIIDSLQWRYATKKFDINKIVPHEKLDVITNAFNLTATSFGLQPLKLVVVKNKKLQKELVQFSMNQEQVAQASHILVFCIETKIDKNYIDSYFDRVKDVRNTSEKIFKPFKEYLISDFNKMTQDKIATFATNQAYIALGSLMTICALEKIDACPMEGFSPNEYDKVLSLKEKGLESVLIMPIGYRASDDMFADFKKVRKPLSESVINL